MCVITNDKHIVLDILFIPGVADYEASGYNVYFPIIGYSPNVGDYFNPNNLN
jgi:hypothetical protein